MTLDVVYKMALPFSCSFSSAQVNYCIVSVIFIVKHEMKENQTPDSCTGCERILSEVGFGDCTERGKSWGEGFQGIGNCFMPSQPHG